MDPASAELIRARIDALQNMSKTEPHLRNEIRTNVTGFFEKHGLIDDNHSIERTRSEARHNPGAIHLCPWHTCAATRHGMPQS